jgi:hypothetical protein
MGAVVAVTGGANEPSWLVWGALALLVFAAPPLQPTRTTVAPTMPAAMRDLCPADRAYWVRFIVSFSS